MALPRLYPRQTTPAKGAGEEAPCCRIWSAIVTVVAAIVIAIVIAVVAVVAPTAAFLPAALFLPAPMAPVFAARSAIPVGLLDGRTFAGRSRCRIVQRHAWCCGCADAAQRH